MGHAHTYNYSKTLCIFGNEKNNFNPAPAASTVSPCPIIAQRENVGRNAKNFRVFTIHFSFFRFLRKHLVIGRFSLFGFIRNHQSANLVCLRYPSLILWDHAKFHFVTVTRRTSYDSGIVRQVYGILRDLPMNHTRFAIWKVHYRNGPKRAGIITTSDYTVRAVYGCNS